VLAGLAVILLIWITPGIGGALVIVVVTGVLVIVVRAMTLKPGPEAAVGAGGGARPETGSDHDASSS